MLGNVPVIASIRERLDTRTGDIISIKADPSKLHIFHAKSEHRINV
jgi:hypothetical protein